MYAICHTYNRSGKNKDALILRTQWVESLPTDERFEEFVAIYKFEHSAKEILALSKEKLIDKVFTMDYVFTNTEIKITFIK